MQVGKEMLNPANKNKDGDGPSFNLLMELLRGDHWPWPHLDPQGHLTTTPKGYKLHPLLKNIIIKLILSTTT